MERFYTILVVSMGLAVFLMAMINERQREFGAMRVLGANLKQLRRLALMLGRAIERRRGVTEVIQYQPCFAFS